MENIHENCFQYMVIASTGLHLSMVTWIWCSERVAASCPVQVIALFHTGRWSCDISATKSFQQQETELSGTCDDMPVDGQEVIPQIRRWSQLKRSSHFGGPIQACNNNINSWKNSRERALQEQHPFWVLELSRCSPWMPNMSRYQVGRRHSPAKRPYQLRCKHWLDKEPVAIKQRSLLRCIWHVRATPVNLNVFIVLIYLQFSNMSGLPLGKGGVQKRWIQLTNAS